MSTDRRTFLKRSLAFGAGAITGFPAILNAAQPWGEIPAGESGLGNYNVLEIYLPGGMSAWETFWVSHDINNNPNWRGAYDWVNGLSWDSCSGSPASSTQTIPFGDDINNTSIHWGPATAPLWSPYIFDRARMVVTAHSDTLHFSAGHRALTGRRFGSPRSAGLGAAIQRFSQGVYGQKATPYSYVLAPAYRGREYFLTYAGSLGQHPGAARPLGLKVGYALDSLLERPGISDEGDALFSKLNEQYRELLRWQGAGNTVRSADYAAYDAAAHYLKHAPSLHPLLGDDQLEVAKVTPCTHDSTHNFNPEINSTRKSIEVAGHLFASGARHVTVIDGGYDIGYLQSPTPYDTHPSSNKNTVEATSANFFNVASSLADNLTDAPAGDAYGVVGPPKINLNDTLVLIHTEFNRTPVLKTEPTDDGYQNAGRDHYPSANVSVLIGGPVVSRGIRGGISIEGDNLLSAVANHPLSATDLHAGVLMAAGVDPLAAGNFTEGDDFSAFVNEGYGTKASEIRKNLREKVLGVDEGFSTTL